MPDKRLFQSKIDPRCSYCARGALLEEGQVLCPRKGVMDPAGSCRSFQYDPLRRTPPKPLGLDTSKLDGEDFSL